MRDLARLLFAHPEALFGGLALAVVLVAALAWLWSERRARALAQLSEDPALARGQARRLAVFVALTLAGLGGAAWWSFGRSDAEPDRVRVIVALATAADGELDPSAPGARALRERIAGELAQLGLDVVDHPDPSPADLADPATLLAQTRTARARWLVRVDVELGTGAGPTDAAVLDHPARIQIALLDAVDGERVPTLAEPIRASLPGRSGDAALGDQVDRLVPQLLPPLLVALASREPIRALTSVREPMTHDEALRADALARLVARADQYTRALALRVQDERAASEAEPVERAAGTHARLSTSLVEEHYIGAAADGRPVLLVADRRPILPEGETGYALAEGSEALLVSDRDGGARELVFTHGNIYGAPAVTADGRTVWLTVDDHGASKTLATVDLASGRFTPVLSHPLDYFTSPIPAPDGRQALFFSRPGRYAAAAIERVAADGTGRAVLISADERGGAPAWAPDGRHVYAPIGAWQRLVEIDVETGARRHLLGQDPDAPALPAEPAPGTTSPAAPTPDPRHGPAIPNPHARVRGPAGPSGPDPATSSRFTAVSVAHDGRSLYVVEQALDGRTWLGVLDLAATASAPGPDRSPYRRLAGLAVGRLLASPTAGVVAFEAPAFTAAGDPDPADQEILVYGPAPGQLRAVTLNAVDDELAGWSSDGRSVFTLQRDRDPGDDRLPVTRLYRHDLP